ncbi:hypothetical protein [Alistipes putredinis]|uniref:hypothetical protein n=1 Tax=Alistipes putredinis TaxID=28117 RepID=UPI003AF5BF82
MEHVEKYDAGTDEEAQRAAMEWVKNLPDYDGLPQHKAITDKPNLYPELTDEQLRECALKWAGTQPDKTAKKG